jgi:hypothetical protein
MEKSTKLPIMEFIKTENLNFKAPSGVIPASLMSIEDSKNELAVVFPGAGYPCSMPLLYYSIDALLLKGYQVLAIDKIYAEDETWRNFQTRESAFKYVEDDTLELFSQISSRFSDRVKVLLGRSLGTYQMAVALENGVVRPRQIVWQTPSLYEKWPVILNCGIPGLGIIGTSDQRYETAVPHFPQDRIVVPDADHAMEIPGDPIKSISILEKVIQKTDAWLMKAES